MLHHLDLYWISDFFLEKKKSRFGGEVVVINDRSMMIYWA